MIRFPFRNEYRIAAIVWDKIGFNPLPVDGARDITSA
ncbi:hypothetical protein SDC9_184710 [bioreactor metagenome]|uniref:Uncharacterized protein n=1 Tax=bioreactor metagenome TaxID=1076179 RepID=A0A645HM59_9ZZZZ